CKGSDRRKLSLTVSARGTHCTSSQQRGKGGRIKEGGQVYRETPPVVAGFPRRCGRSAPPLWPVCLLRCGGSPDRATTPRPKVSPMRGRPAVGSAAGSADP